MAENFEQDERIGHSRIEQIVMRRVRLIRILGLIISTGVFAALAFAIALWGIGREVWVARVFENMPHEGVATFATFWFAAFLHTRVIVQILLLATLTSLFFLAREVARFFSDLFAASRA